MGEVQRRVDIVVSLWIDRDVDVEEVLQEMDYEFTHPAIKDTEIVYVKTTQVDRSLERQYNMSIVNNKEH